jgi:hypothetical protein
MNRVVFIALFLMLGAVGIAQAQADECPTIVAEALESLADLCDALGRNTACYGASMVESTTVAQPRPLNFFDSPGDRAELVQLREIYPQPLDEITQTFGVSVLNVQAQVPDTLPGQAVVFMLVGDARLTNEVAEDSSAETPFQSFYFLPGIGGLNCYEADPMLTIQTPGTRTVTIMLNGVATEMSPGTLLTITPTVCTIHRGNIVRRANGNRAILLANQSVDIQINDEGSIVVTRLRGISEREYQRGVQVQEALNALAGVNAWPEQVVSPPRVFDQEVDSPATPSTCEVQHTVSSGETLHSIARRYNTSVLGIAEANQIADARVIYAGQVLCIPNPESGFEALPAG